MARCFVFVWNRHFLFGPNKLSLMCGCMKLASSAEFRLLRFYGKDDRSETFYFIFENDLKHFRSNKKVCMEKREIPIKRFFETSKTFLKLYFYFSDWSSFFFSIRVITFPSLTGPLTLIASTRLSNFVASAHKSSDATKFESLVVD